MDYRLRLLILSIIVAVSLVPSIILALVLSIIDLILFVALWFIFFLVIRRSQKYVTIVTAVILAFVASVPPYPNYVFVDHQGHLLFHFIGWNALADAAGGTVELFAIYLALFLLAAFVLRYRRQAKIEGAGKTAR